MEYKKAITLIEAMLGWEDIAEQQSKPQSPHCMTHLKAALGNDITQNLNFWSSQPGGDTKNLEKIADYLIEVGSSIKLAMPAAK